MVTSQAVLVLGAGFTRAFYPQAPLMVADYGAVDLEHKFTNFKEALGILEAERSQHSEGWINIERLMTRLEGGMPYDFERGSDQEIKMLLSHLQYIFLNRIRQALTAPQADDELQQLARFCLQNNVTCLTFNYDDAFDRALWKDHQSGRPGPLWDPDVGYGFYLPPSSSLIDGTWPQARYSVPPVLKLHGSINWRIRRGYAPPYPAAALLHHEEWTGHPSTYVNWDNYDRSVAFHFEPDPFIVPPVLMKSPVISEPILRGIWNLAYNILSQATEVIFVGYSLPQSDIATTFLFRESLRDFDVARISVVDCQDSAETTGAKRLVASYSEVFPKLSPDQFSWNGARAWAKEFINSKGAV